jgi:hypothetical protein
MPKKKYYQVNTKKFDRPSVKAKSGGGKGTGILIPNLTRAGKANVQAQALNQANEEYESYYLLHPSHKWIDRFKEADNKREE